MICKNLARNDAGELTFAGVGITKLAEKYGTPLYLYDEERIREKCRIYLDALKAEFGENCQVMYASKAASFKRIYEIVNSEGLGIDVVSMGEIYTAIKAGFPLKNAYFHSNNKTDEDIRYAIENGVGRFVVDNEEELYAIDKIARGLGKRQSVLLRITPGIDPHTYAAVATGLVDSKFGSSIETGQAEEITALALTLENISLEGFHCHVGSQLFDEEVYLMTSRVMLGFIKNIYDRLGYMAKSLDIGGGFGVRYLPEHPEYDIADAIHKIAGFIKKECENLGISVPKISLEPGRSIVADAGMTVYTVGTVKRIRGYKSYVSVDGGMTDNPRFALYNAPYTLLPIIYNGEETFEVTVVGRCCESGDIIQEKVQMPKSIGRGDLIACLTTGAYNYSMASNYNRIPRPPVVMLSGGKDYLAVRRESVEDIASLDI